MASANNDQLSPVSMHQDITLDQLSQLSFHEPISATAGWYPLHVLCRIDMSTDSGYVDLLKSVIQSYPDALMKKTIDGWNPLHIICRNSVSGEGITIVLNASQEAAKGATPDGWFALHQVCLYCQNVEVIKEIYDAYPKASKKITERGTYPSQLLKLNAGNKDPNFYNLVTKACPLLGKKQEIKPVMAMALSKEESEALYLSGLGIQHCVISSTEFSEMAKTPKEGGLYLLHELCQQSARLVEIMEALQTFPQAATIATDDGW
jgi:hypothetical protein